MKKLVHYLKHKLLGITHLYLKSWLSKKIVVHGEDIRTLFECDHLVVLGLDEFRTVSNTRRIVEQGIQNCSLALCISASNFEALYPAFKNVCIASGSVRTLKLSDCSFDFSDIACLVELINDDKSALRNLILCDYEGDQAAVVFSALTDISNLRSLHLENDDNDVVLNTWEEICQNFGNIDTLTELKLLAESCWLPEGKSENKIVKAMASNWSPEAVSLVVAGPDNFITRHMVTLRTQKMLDNIMKRNRMKKLIAAADVALSQTEKHKWMNQLASIWEVPDALSLSYWLLNTRAGCSFNEA